jgi:hypothetical protein
VYSFRRITLAPIVILAGFAIEIYAIFRNPGKPDRRPSTPLRSQPTTGDTD